MRGNFGGRKKEHRKILVRIFLFRLEPYFVKFNGVTRELFFIWSRVWGKNENESINVESTTKCLNFQELVCFCLRKTELFCFRVFFLFERERRTEMMKISGYIV